MNIKEVKVSATIPTSKYANIEPSITVELGPKDDIEKAKQLALSHIEGISQQYAEDGKALVSSDGDMTAVKRELLKCYLSGTEVLYDDAGHTYITPDGKEYVSGSKFAKQFEHPFDAPLIAPRMFKKLEIGAEQVIEYWASKGLNSTSFGTALHQALEHYGKYQAICEKDIDSKTGEMKGYGIHPTLLPIVLSFFEGRENEVAVYEPFIADEKNARCGRIDRFLVVDAKKKICRIQDYKTNNDLYKQNANAPKTLKAPYAFLPNQPISTYAIQLSYYAAIAESHGWTVEGLDLFHWDGVEWVTVELNQLEIDAKQDKIDMSKVI